MLVNMQRSWEGVMGVMGALDPFPHLVLCNSSIWAFLCCSLPE